MKGKFIWGFILGVVVALGMATYFNRDAIALGHTMKGLGEQLKDTTEDLLKSEAQPLKTDGLRQSDNVELQIGDKSDANTIAIEQLEASHTQLQEDMIRVLERQVEFTGHLRRLMSE